ncbi:MAG: hypothetical protein WC044_05270 [Crocinitomicaceae bacterium]
MEIINAIFRLGVILAIFGFIWALIQFAFVLLSGGGQNKSLVQQYGLKAIQYIFLVQVTFLFCYENDSNLALSPNSIIVTGLILAFYFVSKLQRNQNRGRIFSFIQNGQEMKSPVAFNYQAEIAVIVFGLLYFTACVFYPFLAGNPISQWFKESIISIENATIFGFVFRIIGFFFLVSVFGKIYQSILMIIAPKSILPQAGQESKKESDKFDDFEDLTGK